VNMGKQLSHDILPYKGEPSVCIHVIVLPLLCVGSVVIPTDPFHLLDVVLKGDCMKVL